MRECERAQPLSKGTLWAEADSIAAAAAIRELVADPLLAARLGQREAETIGAHFSSEAIGRMLNRRLAWAAMAW
jgi:hypothetical protein